MAGAKICIASEEGFAMVKCSIAGSIQSSSVEAKEIERKWHCMAKVEEGGCVPEKKQPGKNV